MGRTQRDYRSYMLRLYGVRKGGESYWRGSLQSPQSGEWFHFSSLSALVEFLASDGGLAAGAGEHAQANGTAAGEGGSGVRKRRCRLFWWLGLTPVV